MRLTRDEAKEILLEVLDQVTFKRVVLIFFVLAFAPELLQLAGWSIPVLLGLSTSNAAESLAATFLGLLVNAGILFGLLRAGRLVLRRRWHHPAPPGRSDT